MHERSVLSQNSEYIGPKYKHMQHTNLNTLWTTQWCLQIVPNVYAYVHRSFNNRCYLRISYLMCFRLCKIGHMLSQEILHLEARKIEIKTQRSFPYKHFVVVLTKTENEIYGSLDFCYYFVFKQKHLVFVCELLCQCKANKFPGVCVGCKILGSSISMDKSVFVLRLLFHLTIKEIMQSWTLLIVI